MTDLGTLGGTTSVGNAVSANGAVVVGSSLTAGGANHAFRWTGGTMTDLLTLGGTSSAAFGVSADGAVAVGSSFTAGNTASHAVRWDGPAITDLGTLGGTGSIAYGVSANGSVAVGYSQTTGNAATHAVRWDGLAITDLGTLGGISSIAYAVSADGTVAVGRAFIAGNTAQHAVRWDGVLITDLGTLGGTNSGAYGASANGAVVVGTSTTTGDVSTEAFRWIASTGMKSIPALLTGAGVNIAGWQLTEARGVSADGSVIVGNGTNPGGNAEGWIARLCDQPGTCSGLITMSGVAQSFASLGALGQTGNAAVGSTLGALTEYATQAQHGQGNSNAPPYSVFASAAYDTDPTASGSLGATMRLGRAIIAGATVGADSIRTNMALGGSARMAGGSGGVFVARVPDSGLQWLAGLAGLTIDGDIARGYFNGSSLTASLGHTRGSGYGALARIGWSFDAIKRTQVTPFVSYTTTRIHYGAYTETSGAFPALINAFTDRAQTSRLGVDARYSFTPQRWMWGTLAWAHRLDGGKTADIAGTLLGLFPLSTPGISVAQDWLEATVGVRAPLGPRGAVTASLTASVPEHQATTYVARLGVSQTF